MPRDPIKNTMEAPVSELIALTIGYVTACDKFKAKYGNELETHPKSVRRFIKLVELVADEHLAGL